MQLHHRFFAPALALALLLGATRESPAAAGTRLTTALAPAAPDRRFDAVRQSASYKIALAPHRGDTALDESIRRAQQAVRTAPDPRPYLEKLGWLFVAQARASHDPGFYKLAEHCALALGATGVVAQAPPPVAGPAGASAGQAVHRAGAPGGQDTGEGAGATKAENAGAWLLRGHVLQALHRFAEAEAIARRLTAQRDVPFDFGLLGDALADQGKLDEAITAYQRMVDLRPGLQAYSRIAHVRWLRGDLPGALEVAELAAQAASPVDAESAAWAWARVAFLQFQSGDNARAAAACDTALRFVTNHPPALLVRGRMQLAAGQAGDAVESFRRAVAKDPLPDHLWWLAEALRAAQSPDEAAKVERELVTRGASDDPRTVALFLATRGLQGVQALTLAERELTQRADVFTHDAVAWARFANGRAADAWPAMQRALAEGTPDARLFLHAGVIATKLGRADGTDWLGRARKFQHLLMPSERTLLDATTKPALAATR